LNWEACAVLLCRRRVVHLANGIHTYRNEVRLRGLIDFLTCVGRFRFCRQANAVSTARSSHLLQPVMNSARMRLTIAVLVLSSPIELDVFNRYPGTTAAIADSGTRVVCETDGTTYLLPIGMPSIVDSVCPALDECEDPKNTDNPGCGRSPDVLNPNPPNIISPRNQILNTQPKFRWLAVPGSSRYTVTLNRGSQVIWGLIEVEETEITYAGEMPLSPGPSYELTVKADNGATAIGRFNILNEVDRAEVMKLLAMQPTDTADGIPLQVYVYLDRELFSEAIDTLETAISNGNRSAAVPLKLGELYRRMELPFLAEQAYLTALEFSTKEGNLKGQALAHTRLGILYKSRDNSETATFQFSQAKTLYEQAGAIDLARKIEQVWK
jgi:hypothetical protein